MMHKNVQVLLGLSGVWMGAGYCCAVVRVCRRRVLLTPSDPWCGWVWVGVGMWVCGVWGVGGWGWRWMYVNAGVTGAIRLIFRTANEESDGFLQ